MGFSLSSCFSVICCTKIFLLDLPDFDLLLSEGLLRFNLAWIGFYRCESICETISFPFPSELHISEPRSAIPRELSSSSAERYKVWPSVSVWTSCSVSLCIDILRMFSIWKHSSFWQSFISRNCRIFSRISDNQLTGIGTVSEEEIFEPALPTPSDLLNSARLSKVKWCLFGEVGCCELWTSASQTS